MSIAIKECVRVDGSRTTLTRDGIRTHVFVVAIRKPRRRPRAEGKQCEVRTAEDVEEPHRFAACGTNAGGVGSTIAGTNPGCVIDIVCERAAAVGEAQLAGVGEGLFAREQIGDPLTLAGKGLVEFLVANGCRNQNALSDG